MDKIIEDHIQREQLNQEIELIKPVRRKSNKKNLKAKILNIDAINDVQILRMYQIYSKYYEEHNLETFKRDLFEKTKVILLIDKVSNTIQGFSTILKFKKNLGGHKYIGIYSGDTVLEEKFWGSAALGVAFLKYLWAQKVKNVGVPVYWFLISKGYKTYLLMSNNFKTHYPRYEGETPQRFSNIMANFYEEKFLTSFEKESGLIKPQNLSTHLKSNVACISKVDLANERIRFFQNKNPDWTKGNELCCIAKMTYFMPVKYGIKKMLKRRKKRA